MVFQRLKKLNLQLQITQSNELKQDFFKFINQLTKECHQLEQYLIEIKYVFTSNEVGQSQMNQDLSLMNLQQIGQKELLQNIFHNEQILDLSLYLENFEIWNDDLFNIFRHLPLLNSFLLNVQCIKSNPIQQLNLNNLKIDHIKNLSLCLLDFTSEETLLQIIHLIELFQNLLYLSFNFCVSNNLSCQVFDTFGEVLSQKQYMRSLKLSLKEFDPQKLMKLFEGIKLLILLETLDLSFPQTQFTQQDILYVRDCVQNLKRLECNSFEDDSFNSLYLLNLINDLPFIGDYLFFKYGLLYSYKINQIKKILPFDNDKNLNDCEEIQENLNFPIMDIDVQIELEFNKILESQKLEEINWIFSQNNMITHLKIDIIEIKQDFNQEILLFLKSLGFCKNLKELSFDICDCDKLETQSIIEFGNLIKKLQNTENIFLCFRLYNNDIYWDEAKNFLESFSFLTNIKRLQLQILGQIDQFKTESVQLLLKSISSLQQLESIDLHMSVEIELEELNLYLSECFENLKNIRQIKLEFPCFNDNDKNNSNKQFCNIFKRLSKLYILNITAWKINQRNNYIYKLNRLVQFENDFE